MQEIQQKLDRYNNNMREGAQEYVQLCYYNDWSDSRDDYYYLYIFRDGTAYYDGVPDYGIFSCSHRRHALENLLGNSANLYDFLLEKMKQGSEKYML